MTTNKHEELVQFMPPAKERAERKMLSVSLEAYNSITTISAEMNVSRTKVVDSLVKFYLEGE